MTTETKSYPVNIRGDLSAPPERGWWLIKWLLAIPHYIVLVFLAIAFVIVCIIAFFAILFTGKYPRGLFDFNAGVLRWGWRVAFYSYGALATDKYPPFSLEPDPNYPADLEIPYPEKLSRGLVLVKWWLLAIPHYIIVSLFTSGPSWTMRGWDWTMNDRVYHMEGWQISFGGLIFIVAIFAGLCVLFTGKYPKDLFKLALGFNRWAIRVAAYASLMTDEYPPFRLWDD
ncbi:MAG: hypothetical protein A2Z15_08875 [Chloroflexi bacterium RBG_16_50_11]|nr:MAG: hypothetical protein A2Z15_08875 [Chloroflexi bacterium RBG_16_50_11]